jgi:hypothetical protein
MYLPAMIASRPDVAMIIAGFLGQLYFFTPVTLVCFQGCVRGRRPAGEEPVHRADWMPLLLFCMAVLICASSQSLAYSGFQIHVDAPALGYAGLACVMTSRALFAPRRGLRLPGMTSIALLVALAVFTKQTLLPLLPALALAVAVRRGLPTAAVFGAILVVAIGVVLGILGAVFGFEAMAFHAIAIPLAHPRDKSFLSVIPGPRANASPCSRCRWLCSCAGAHCAPAMWARPRIESRLQAQARGSRSCSPPARACRRRCSLSPSRGAPSTTGR